MQLPHLGKLPKGYSALGHMSDVAEGFDARVRLGKRRARWYKAVFLAGLVFFVLANWRRDCDFTNFDSTATEACVSLIAYITNMALLALITPLLVLTEL